VFQRVHTGSLSEAQIQVLLLTNAVTNACTWAVAFHTALALRQGVDPADVQAIRDCRPPVNPEHAALSKLARSLIEHRGRVSDHELQAFVSAGFKVEQILEVILVSAASTITNYVGSATQPPVEDAFQPYLWQG
jgi:AhpD family alkylhydroperoxidase